MEAQSKQRQYGLWESPISPLRIARRKSFKDVGWAGETLIWSETKGSEGVLMAAFGCQAARELNGELRPGGCVGYGGGAFYAKENKVYFVDRDSGRIYYQPLQGMARPISPQFGGAASPKLSPDGKWLLYVQSYENRDSIALLSTAGDQWPVKLIQGDDFYMQPAWHPDGDRIAWIAWNQPDMPWDRTHLRIGSVDFSGGTFPEVTGIFDLAKEESSAFCQPEFSPDGRYLAYISDQRGWWQLYLLDLKSLESHRITTFEAEHALPHWEQGMRSYGFSPDGKYIVFIRYISGYAKLFRIRLSDGSENRIPIKDGYAWFEQIAVAPDGERIATIASGPQIPNQVIGCRLDGVVSVHARSASDDIPQDYYPIPQPVTWDGNDGGIVHGLFYPPANPDFEGRGLPPLIVNVHSGPTGQASALFEPKVAFFTSRGYAVLRVNYRGSAGYGRAYRNMLHGNWGIYDVEDSVRGAKEMVERKLVDKGKLVISGSSAGGFSVLKALEDYPGFFKAGVCLYGVSNQFELVNDIPKFEAHYNDSLLGPLPEAAEIYRQRSPVFYADRIRDPLALYHGEDDPVVSKSQSDEIAASLRRRGVPHIYHSYPGEGHGFRKLETLEHHYATLEKFLRRHVIYA
jgi:dipeptidyl aminopeptidase/acylaminoacyl peptidase